MNLYGASVNVSFSPFDFSVGIGGKLYSEYVLDAVGVTHNLRATSCVLAKVVRYGLPIQIKKRRDYSSVIDIALHMMFANWKKGFTTSAGKI